MTRAKVKQVFTLDRAIHIAGFLVLFVGFGVSWEKTQGDIKANAAEIVDVRLDSRAADKASDASNQTRFEKLDQRDEKMQDIITGQAVLLERIVTTTEFTQRDVQTLIIESQKD